MKSIESPLKPTVTMQQEALSAAIADIIWKAGGNQYGIICLPHPSQSHLENSDHFNQDGMFLLVGREFMSL